MLGLCRECSADGLNGNRATFSYIIIGIQHTGNVLSQVSVQNSLNVATDIDYKEKAIILVDANSYLTDVFLKIRALCQIRTVFQVKIARRLCRPQPHGVDNVVSVAWDRGVIRQSQHYLSIP